MRNLSQSRFLAAKPIAVLIRGCKIHRSCDLWLRTPSQSRFVAAKPVAVTIHGCEIRRSRASWLRNPLQSRCGVVALRAMTVAFAAIVESIASLWVCLLCIALATLERCAASQCDACSLTHSDASAQSLFELFQALVCMRRILR